MRKLFIAIVPLLIMIASGLYAQEQSEDGGKGEMDKYRRSSLYSALIKHSKYPYAAEIDSAFKAIPIPDKFNEHNVEPRSFESTMERMRQKGDKKEMSNLSDIDDFFSENQIAKGLIAKWFDRDSTSGTFDMNLIQERGFYDASQLDIANAASSTRGKAVLGDAGESLIGKTFVMVNDITFIDRGVVSSIVGSALSILGSLGAAVTGNKSIEDAGELAGKAASTVDGFKVNITTYLYRLIWDEETAGTFYKNLWVSDSTQTDRKKAFDESDIFRLEYIGQTSTSAQNLSAKGMARRTKSEQMLKVCTRAVDRSIVELQREYDEFKVNAPIFSISEDGKTVDVKIGLKEGVNEKSEYEVLMPTEDENGILSYEKIGSIEPVKGMIWDNRFGALEEAHDLKAGKDQDKALAIASLNATTFKVKTGSSRIVPGCVVREKTIKSEKKK